MSNGQNAAHKIEDGNIYENQPKKLDVKDRGLPDAPNGLSTSEKRDEVGPALADQTAKADGQNGGDVARDKPRTRNEILEEIRVALQKDRESGEMRGCRAGKSVELRIVGDDISYYACVQKCFAHWNKVNVRDLDFKSTKVSQPYDDPTLAAVEIPCLPKSGVGSFGLCTETSEGTFATAECTKTNVKHDFQQSFVMVVHVESVDSLLRLWKSFGLTPP